MSTPNPLLRSLVFTALLEDEVFAKMPYSQGEQVITDLTADLDRDRPKDMWAYSQGWIVAWRSALVV